MEDERIDSPTVRRIREKMRAAVEADPDSPLALFLEDDPGEDYDPTVPIEDRQPDG